MLPIFKNNTMIFTIKLLYNSMHSMLSLNVFHLNIICCNSLQCKISQYLNLLIFNGIDTDI